MHEYSIVAALIDRVAREAAAQQATSVGKLHVSIGDLAGVERELLATAFDTFKPGTICENSELLIRAVPARWECPQCHVARPLGEILRCAACGVAARLVQGDEIILDRVEMEVDRV